MGMIGDAIEMFRYSHHGQIETKITTCIDINGRQMMEAQLNRDERTDPLGRAAAELVQVIETQGNQQKEHSRDLIYERRSSVPF